MRRSMLTRRTIVTQTVNLDGLTTWTAPAGAFQLTNVKAWGAGGGARGGILLGRGSAGGQSGAKAERTSTFAILPGDTITISNGAKGLGSAYNTNTATAGGFTIYTHDRTGTVLVKANGGAQSTGATGLSAGSTTGMVGDVLTAGTGSASSGGTTGSAGTDGGTAPGGGVGGIGSNTAASGTNGAVRGGAGGGGKGNQTGSGGGDGGPGGGELTYQALV